jgi:cellulose biosynthesis protein BcsQ
LTSVLALHHLKGGVGKTTVATHLAHLFARAGQATLLWDLDPQGAASWIYRTELDSAARPRRFLSEPDELFGAIRGSDFEHLDVLPADLSLERLERTLAREREPARGFAAALDRLRGHYARIVLDCAPGLGALNGCVFACADALLVPTIPSALSLRTLALLHRHLKPHRRRGLLVLPFFSMVDTRKASHREVRAFARTEALGFLASEIPHSAWIESAAARRQPLTALAPDSPAVGTFEELAREVERRTADAPSDDGLRRARLEEFLVELRR